MNEDRKKVADWWGDPANYQGNTRTQWSEHPLVARYVNERATGDPAHDWVYHLERFLPPRPRRALSLACGTGVIERALRERDICQSVEGVDIAEGAITDARCRSAGIDGLAFAVVDLETADLPTDTYDVVVAHAALHHLFHLERVLATIHRALKPAGILVVFDYVGPSQMQFPRAHLAIADAMLQSIPERYRAFRRWGGIKEQAPVLPLDQMNAVDPSEGIRAREIIPLIAARFSILHIRPIGGTLLLLVLNEIVGNFDPDDPGDSLHIERLIAAERSLIDSGMLPSYHAYMICGKSDTPTPIQTLIAPPEIAGWL